ncbi:MAG: hypothetical protein ACSHWN_07040 [Methylophilaceae bacterium]
MSIFRKDLCDFPSLAVEHARRVGCEIGEAVEDLSDTLINNENITLYDGSFSSTVEPIRSYKERVRVFESIFNYYWWLGHVSDSEFDGNPYNLLLSKLEIKKLFGYDNIAIINDDYFRQLNEHENKNTESSGAEKYQTKLMQLMDKVLERYYGSLFDINDRDTWPKQKDVTEWLKEKHNLSHREAISIDLVTRPDEARKR